MADIYVWSGSTDATKDGTTWDKAYTTLWAALAANPGNNNVFFVADDHVGVTAAAVNTGYPTGSQANVHKVLCVRRVGGSVPPVPADLRTTAQETTTGASNIQITQWNVYMYGLTLVAGSGATTAHIILGADGMNALFEKCKFKLGGTSAAQIQLGTGAGPRIRWVDCDVEFSGTGQWISPLLARWRWQGGAFTGAVIPNVLFQGPNSTSSGRWLIEGVDFSAFTGSGKTLVTPPTGYINRDFHFHKCKLGAVVTLATTSQFAGGPSIMFIDCDSAGSVIRREHYSNQGVIRHDTAVYRTGGAAIEGTPYSQKFTSSASFVFGTAPWELEPLSFWNSTIGSPITVTVYGLHDGTAQPTNGEIWLEAMVMDQTGFTLAERYTNRGSDGFLVGGTAYPVSGAAWTSSGLVNAARPFEMSLTFTPRTKGTIQLQVCGYKATASAPLYIDPLPVVS